MSLVQVSAAQLISRNEAGLPGSCRESLQDGGRRAIPTLQTWGPPRGRSWPPGSRRASEGFLFKISFLDVDHFLKVFIVFVAVLLLSYVLVFWP